LVGVGDEVLAGDDVTGDWGEAVFGGAGAAAPVGTEVPGDLVAARDVADVDNDGDKGDDG
jgi:hypothetical protein